jgi:23S rRNA C2498 (ribose-2'-O)-methylase RlmM
MDCGKTPAPDSNFIQKKAAKSRLFLCRYDFSSVLAEEIMSNFHSCPNENTSETDKAVTSANSITEEIPGFGAILQKLPLDNNPQAIPEHPFIFERQRIPYAEFIPVMNQKQMAREIVKRILPSITISNDTWTIHSYTPDTQTEKSMHAVHTAKLPDIILEICKERFSRVFRRYIPCQLNAVHYENAGRVLQICHTDKGVWSGASETKYMSDTRPGGVHRMAFDSLAPSRSYLKIEEAFERMNCRPAKGQTVVDLGAAPGGWTYAFLKRKCSVTAVDNGPLKLAGFESPDLTHVRSDGITFTPPQSTLLPVDWLVSDMLTDPGTNMGMLRKWLDNRWMRNCIINIKLPQAHPWKAIKSFKDFLEKWQWMHFSIRQLYHDRREVTIMGTINKCN